MRQCHVCSGESMSKIADLFQKNESELLAEWVKEQLATSRRRDLMDDTQLQTQSAELLRAIATAARNGNVTDISGSDWSAVRERLTEISSVRAKQGFSPAE